MTTWGCVADDFTGATDIGSVLAAAGRDVVVVFDTARVDRARLRGADAIVVALKSRTAPVAESVADSVAATRWLVAQGADRLYVKYCSTFDSTPSGNIGPVIEALMGELGLTVALVAPSYPRNGRTVYQGHLFVHREPLNESPMRDHPLTPMRDSSLARLLAPQTEIPLDHLYLDEIRAGRAVAGLVADDERRIVIADAIDDQDLIELARAAGEHVLLTGGAGLALGLGTDETQAPGALLPVGGEKLIVSGSASATTRAQIAHARDRMAVRKLDLAGIRTEEEATRYADELFSWVRAQWGSAPGRPVLVYATDDLDDIVPDAGASERVEAILAGVVRRAAEDRLGALIVAGGETSGRVVQELGIADLRIGPAIAPGVVWADASTTAGHVAVALKSGNFGDEDMFTSAWEHLA